MDHVKGLIHGEKGNQQPAAAPAQPAQPAQQPAPAPQEEHHHGAGIGKKLGNAATFGAGATLGSDAVNGVIGALGGN